MRGFRDSTRELGQIAEVDGLPNIANRYSFDRRFTDVWNDALEHGFVTSLILIDIDHFSI